MSDATPWRIDPDTLNLVGGAQPPEGFSAREFAAQLWPPCPSCGSTIDVDAIKVQSKLDPEPPRFITGGWQCPRGCPA